MVEAFSEFGDITRLILQTYVGHLWIPSLFWDLLLCLLCSSFHTFSDDTASNQHAVLIYSTTEAAEKAVGFSGKVATDVCTI